MKYKLGKKPATRDDRDLLFAHYRTTAIQQAPVGFDHTSLVTNPWGMMVNDRLGCCAIAGPGHETMLLNAAAGKQVTFTDSDIIAAYSAITGYNPADPSTDQGSAVRDVLAYRASTGLTDANDDLHKIGAYVALTAGDWNELLEALYVFECVGIGIQFPGSAMDQFNSSKPWDVPVSAFEGGHYVPVVARPAESMVEVITWGAKQLMTEAFYSACCDEAWAFVSEEDLTAGKSLEGFNLDDLAADLDSI